MLSREQVKTLRDDLQEVLNAASEKLGYKLTLGNCSFGATANFKLEAAPFASNGEVVSREAEDFKRYAELYQLKAEYLGKTFRHNGRPFTITGLKPRSRRFP